MRAGCRARLYLAGRRRIKNNSTKHRECVSVSTTVPNHHTSSRIITSTVHHTSANNFIRAHLNGGAVTARSINGVGVSWTACIITVRPGVGVAKPPPPPPPKKEVGPCFPDVRYSLERRQQQCKQATCLITVWHPLFITLPCPN